MGINYTVKLAKMNNGEYWVYSVDWSDSYKPRMQWISSRSKSYEEAEVALKKLCDEIGDEPNVTFEVLPQEQLNANIHFVKGRLEIRISERRCECFFTEDLTSPQWEVVDYAVNDSGWWPFAGRVLWTGLTYPEAVTSAYHYAAMEPGEYRVTHPTHYQERSRDHDQECFTGRLEWDFVTPKATGADRA